MKDALYKYYSALERNGLIRSFSCYRVTSAYVIKVRKENVVYDFSISNDILKTKVTPMTLYIWTIHKTKEILEIKNKGA